MMAWYVGLVGGNSPSYHGTEAGVKAFMRRLGVEGEIRSGRLHSNHFFGTMAPGNRVTVAMPYADFLRASRMTDDEFVGGLKAAAALFPESPVEHHTTL